MNLEGSHLLRAAIEGANSTYRGNTYGGLVLHIADQTTLSKLTEVVDAALHQIDDRLRATVFDIIDQVNTASTSRQFWKAHPDEMAKRSGLSALDIWRENGFATNKEQFRNLQNFIFDFILVNFVMTIQGSNKSRSFVKMSVGQGVLGRLFGG